MEIVLSEIHGFCRGVTKAIDVVESALKSDKKIYVYREIVHNRYVVERLKEKGVHFIDSIEDVPTDAILILPAHGTAQSIRNRAEKLNIVIIDAVCPIVGQMHKIVQECAKLKCLVVLIGKKNHAEVQGLLGCTDLPIVKVVENIKDVEILKESLSTYSGEMSCIIQTTTNAEEIKHIIDALKKYFPFIRVLNTTCHATRERQEAARNLASHVNLMLVIGSQNSSNSNRLMEIGIANGTPSYLIDSEESISPLWFEGIEKVGIVSGASTPKDLVERVVAYLHRTLNITRVSVLKCEKIIQ